MPEFRFDKLQPHQLRLAWPELNNNGVLRIQLKTVTMSKSLSYKALSYVWGPKETHSYATVELHDDENKGTMQISRNLNAALQVFTSSDSGPIWIDALCIWQDNEIEKAQQVPKMHEIFGHASQVIIWLGSSDGGSDLAMELCDWLHNQRSTNSRSPENILDFQEYSYIQAALSGPRRPNLTVSQLNVLASILNQNQSITITEDNYRLLGLPEFTDPIWLYLNELFNRDWLSRVWTFEEKMVAQQAVVQCGPSRITWDSYYETGMRLSQTQMLWSSWLMRHKDKRHGNDLTSLRSFKKDLRLAEDFPQFLHEARYKSSSKKVDFIYGLCALATQDIRSKIPVSYAQDWQRDFWKLYTIVAKVMIQTYPMNFTLAAVESKDRPSRLPSWCPDYSSPPQYNVLHIRGRASAFQESDRQLSQASLAPTHIRSPLSNRVVNPGEPLDPVLRIGGFSADTVHDIVENFDWKWSFTPSANEGRDGHASKIFDWLERVERFVARQEKDTKKAEDVYWETLLAHTPFVSGTGANYEEFPRRPKDGVKALGNRLHQLTFLSQDERPALTEEERHLLQPVMTYMGALWPGRVFFSTTNGLFGVASQRIEKGDKVCLFLSMEMPVVIRPKNTHQYEFVSIAYVRGLMHGEALVGKQFGQHEMFNLC